MIEYIHTGAITENVVIGVYLDFALQQSRVYSVNKTISRNRGNVSIAPFLIIIYFDFSSSFNYQ